MTWSRTLENSLASEDINKEFKEWTAITKERPNRRGSGFTPNKNLLMADG